jgi:cystathionine beta-lyase
MAKKNPDERKKRHISTLVTQIGRKPEDQFGFINPPTYRGSTVLFPDVATLESLNQPYTYGTKGTPTVRSLEEAWSILAGAEDSVTVPSGLAAICLAVMTATQAGDHILITDSVYQPTRNFCDNILAKFGVLIEYYDPHLSDQIFHLFREQTTAIIVESPGSQSMEIQDVPAISKAAHEKGICVILDNTWATPIFFPPHDRGADLVIEAGTKYLSGHSDLLIGLVSANKKWAKRLRTTFNAFAIGAGPDECSLALRGLRTMALRLNAQQKSALEIADWLSKQEQVESVLHPALISHPDHNLWKRDFLGSSGVFSIILNERYRKYIAEFLDKLELFGIGFSWGGYESLVLPFDCNAYRTATRWDPPGPCLRFSIGIEDVIDLKEDLTIGLMRLS